MYIILLYTRVSCDIVFIFVQAFGKNSFFKRNLVNEMLFWKKSQHKNTYYLNTMVFLKLIFEWIQFDILLSFFCFCFRGGVYFSRFSNFSRTLNVLRCFRVYNISLNVYGICYTLYNILYKMIYIFLNTVKLYNPYIIIYKLNNYLVIFNYLCDQFTGNHVYFTGNINV